MRHKHLSSKNYLTCFSSIANYPKNPRVEQMNLDFIYTWVSCWDIHCQRFTCNFHNFTCLKINPPRLPQKNKSPSLIGGSSMRKEKLTGDKVLIYFYNHLFLWFLWLRRRAVYAPNLSRIEMIWNCRGLGWQAAVRTLNVFIKTHHPSLLFIFEIFSSSLKKIKRIFSSLGFNKLESVPAVGRSGGLVRC